MPYAEKRDDKLTGRWISEFRGKFPKRSFDTKRAAEGYEAFVKAAGYEPENLQNAKLSGPTFKETVVLMRAKKAKGSRDPSGARRLDYLVSRFGHLALSAITTTELDKLVDDLEKRPAQVSGADKIGPSTINRYLSAVSAVFTWAKDRDRDLQPPTIPWRREKGHRIHWFSEEQEATLVDLMTSRGWLAEALTMKVLCATGMRWGEFAGLEPHQCQSEWVLLDHTKTDTPRDVPIDADLARELKAMVCSGTVPKYLPMRRHLKVAVKTCGYSSKLGVHNCRHSTATRLIKLGVPLPIVQKFLGHRDIKTTMRYVHVEADDLMKASKELYPRCGYLPEKASKGRVVALKKSTATGRP